jgi:hypothetical protein
MVDAALRLLSLANQLAHNARQVRLEFGSDTSDLVNYLNRMGFFDCLSRRVEVDPCRPPVSRANLYRGSNDNLVEIAQITRTDRENVQKTPGHLADIVSKACFRRPDVKSLRSAAFTVFAELIGNIYDHSSTPIDGYAALQLYRRRGSLRVAVSDSGVGVFGTLRDALKKENSPLNALPDSDLFLEIIRQGLSRHGPGRGNGIKGSAERALKYRANVDVRLPRALVKLTPDREGFVATGHAGLPLLWGTHFALKFNLTRA